MSTCRDRLLRAQRQWYPDSHPTTIVPEHTRVSRASRIPQPCRKLRRKSPALFHVPQAHHKIFLAQFLCKSRILYFNERAILPERKNDSHARSELFCIKKKRNTGILLIIHFLPSSICEVDTFLRYIKCEREQ